MDTLQLSDLDIDGLVNLLQKEKRTSEFYRHLNFSDEEIEFLLHAIKSVRERG